MLAHEVCRKQRDIAFTIPQSRNVNRKTTDPVVEVRPKFAALDRMNQVAIGSSYQAHVGMQRLGSSKTLEFSRLQDTQQFALQLDG